MKSILLAAALLVFGASAASAQFVIAPSGGLTLMGHDVVQEDGSTKKEWEQLADILAEVGYQFAWNSDGTYWGEIVALYGAQVDQSDMWGLGVRSYLDFNPSNNVYPGFGVLGFAIPSQQEFVDETSIVVGGELLLEVLLPDADGSDNGNKITAYAGLYDSVSGDEFQIVRFGIRTAIN